MRPPDVRAYALLLCPYTRFRRNHEPRTVRHRRRWLVSASAVFALHLALFYGLTNGLRRSLTPFDIGPVEARLLDERVIEPVEPPPPPPRIPALRVDTVPLPEIAIDLPAESARAISLPASVSTPAPSIAASAPILVPPRIDYRRSRIAPEYPSVSKRLGEQGKVVVLVHVLADGRAGEVKLLKSSGYPRLDAAALDHVLREWRFVPARSDGEAIATWGPFAVTFMITR